MKTPLLFLAASFALCAQPSPPLISTTTTGALIRYNAPTSAPCSLQVADMQRAITVTSSAYAGGTVTITTAAAHGLLVGSVVTAYLEKTNVPAWDGWQALTILTATTFSFASSTGTATTGNVGVLVDDVNPALFGGSDQDTRSGVLNGPGLARVFVIGLHLAQKASDGNSYSRALQANARHHYTLTCGTPFDAEFLTHNIPLGETYNMGIPVDRSTPGKYAYPTVQWGNVGQALIDPVTGMRSHRLFALAGTASAVTNFDSVPTPPTGWTNGNGPLSSGGGAATYTGGSCSGGGIACALFLRADTLQVGASAPTYSFDSGSAASLDWFQVSTLASMNAARTGSDANFNYCLTLDRVTCPGAVLTQGVTTTPTAFLLGTRNLMDLWQGSGPAQISRADVSQHSGFVTYVAATKVVSFSSGYVFSIRWGAGSNFTMGGVEYTITSVQSENTLTLLVGPLSDTTAPTAYTANNFGVLIWKQSATPDQLSIGYATYQYGSSGISSWPSDAQAGASPVVVVNGVPGNMVFFGAEIFWLSQDGSDVRDLGASVTSYSARNEWGERQCGTSITGDSSNSYGFDPLDGRSWYCILNAHFGFDVNGNATKMSLVKVHYGGDFTPTATPGAAIPDCDVTSPPNTEPCLTFTNMMPNLSDTISQAGPLFNSDYAGTNYVNLWTPQVYNFFLGTSPDGDFAVETRSTGQDYPGWIWVWTLGTDNPTTPVGTDAGSVRLIASASTYHNPPFSYCTIHDLSPPDQGWIKLSANDMAVHSSFDPKFTYTATLTSTPLNITVGVPGGPNACPSNPFSITGNNCTAITVGAQPIRASDSTSLQNIMVGDVMRIGTAPEYVRVLIAAYPNYTVQRGYFSSPQITSSTSMIMTCAIVSSFGFVGIWNYRNDPLGANISWDTIKSDPQDLDTHAYFGGGIPSPPVTQSVGIQGTFSDPTLCPGNGKATCIMTRLGFMNAAIGAPESAVSINPLFAGIPGNIGIPNDIDSHSGPCFNGWCMDARPMLGDDGGYNVLVQGFVNTAGQLWKATGADTKLNRKIFATMAYVGRSALVDVSGAGSALGSTSSDSYKYCYVLVAGECESGSSVGDYFVNAPYVSSGGCPWANVGNQMDDRNEICIGDLGTYVGSLVQWGYGTHDMVGAGNRRLGPNFNRWNSYFVYWNSQATPSGNVLTTFTRWMDGLRHEPLLNFMPPMTAADGVNRATFLPVSVQIAPPAGLGVSTAIVEFGYKENGSNLYCTSRQEPCVAVTGAINEASPFYYEIAEAGLYTGWACSTSCTVVVPAHSQSTLYYRARGLNSGGAVVWTGPLQVVLTQ